VNEQLKSALFLYGIGFVFTLFGAWISPQWRSSYPTSKVAIIAILWPIYLVLDIFEGVIPDREKEDDFSDQISRAELMRAKKELGRTRRDLNNVMEANGVTKLYIHREKLRKVLDVADKALVQSGERLEMLEGVSDWAYKKPVSYFGDQEGKRRVLKKWCWCGSTMLGNVTYFRQRSTLCYDCGLIFSRHEVLRHEPSKWNVFWYKRLGYFRYQQLARWLR